MNIGTVEVIGILMVIVTVGTLLMYLDLPPRNKARYSGLVYDPQRPVIRRAGAVGYTGRTCPLCGEVTFSNYNDRCGACGRLNVHQPVIPVEAKARVKKRVMDSVS
jgi:hypothetical protein